MDWVLIITTIIELIQECRENQDRATILSRLRRPGLRETVLLRRAIRQQTGLHGRALTARVREGIQVLAEQTDEQLGDLMDEVEAAVADSNS